MPFQSKSNILSERRGIYDLLPNVSPFFERLLFYLPLPFPTSVRFS